MKSSKWSKNSNEIVSKTLTVKDHYVKFHLKYFCVETGLTRWQIQVELVPDDADVEVVVAADRDLWDEDRSGVDPNEDLDQAAGRPALNGSVSNRYGFLENKSIQSLQWGMKETGWIHLFTVNSKRSLLDLAQTN